MAHALIRKNQQIYRRDAACRCFMLGVIGKDMIINKIIKYACSLTLLMVLVDLCGCTPNSKVAALRRENDSLRVVKVALEREVNAYFQTMNEINDNLERMQAIEDSVVKETCLSGVNNTPSERVKQNLRQIEKILQDNSERLAALNARMKSSTFKMDEFQKAIAKLSQTVTEKNSNIESLYAELSEKAALLVQQEISIQGLRQGAQRQQQRLREKELQINQAYYTLDSYKHLKQRGIINGNVFNRKILQGNLDKSDFIRIDIRDFNDLLISSKRSKILTSHPKSSYTLQEEGGKTRLHINDPQQFWSISKYLVIQMD